MSVSHTWLAHNLEAALLWLHTGYARGLENQLCTGSSHAHSGELFLLSSAQNSALCGSELAPQHLCSNPDGLDTAHAQSGAGSSEAQQQRAFTAAESFFPSNCSC